MRKEKIGDVYKISVSKDTFCFAQIVHIGLIRIFTNFFDFSALFPNIISELSQEDSFVVFVHKSYASDQNWSFQGNYSLVSTELPLFFRQDIFDFEKCMIIDVFGNQRKVMPHDCLGLERAAIWDPEHVVKRLNNLRYRIEDENVKILSLRLK
jgi:hypothetical protein